MPEYSYFNKKTKKTITVFQSMNEPHIYIDKKGVAWERIFEVPQAQIDTKIDPFSGKEFVEKTNKKNLNLGQMWEMSGELGAKRAAKDGKDFQKEAVVKNYEVKCKGKKHPHA